MVNYFKVNLDKALISLATGILNLHVLNQQSDCIINKLAGLFGFFFFNCCFSTLSLIRSQVSPCLGAL